MTRRHQAVVSTNTPRNPDTPLSLKLRASVCRNNGKLGMPLSEDSVDVSDDEFSDVQRFWKTVVKLPEPLALDDMLPELEFNACARLEKVDALFLYCCTCCAALGCCGKDGSGALPVAVASSEPAVRGAEVSPSCVNAPAIAEAIGLASVVEGFTGARRAVAVDPLSSFL
jgi:hypothetical protein